MRKRPFIYTLTPKLIRVLSQSYKPIDNRFEVTVTHRSHDGGASGRRVASLHYDSISELTAPKPGSYDYHITVINSVEGIFVAKNHVVQDPLEGELSQRSVVRVVRGVVARHPSREIRRKNELCSGNRYGTQLRSTRSCGVCFFTYLT